MPSRVPNGSAPPGRTRADGGPFADGPRHPGLDPPGRPDPIFKTVCVAVSAVAGRSHRCPPAARRETTSPAGSSATRRDPPPSGSRWSPQLADLPLQPSALPLVDRHCRRTLYPGQQVCKTTEVAGRVGKRVPGNGVPPRRRWVCPVPGCQMARLAAGSPKCPIHTSVNMILPRRRRR